jgi:dTDP-4-dehydrorhamnose reductase
MTMTKLWIPGGTGMLGQAVAHEARQRGLAVLATGRTLDIADENSVSAFIAQHQPELIINCAAYTQVDKAESEPAEAMRINADGPAVLGRAAARSGAFVVHVSTDYVFDGVGTRPWLPSDAPRPTSVYGRSKWLGEQHLQQATPGCSVVRTSWLYGPGGKNFVATMLALMATRDELRVVDDQIGRPTSTPTLARGLVTVAMTRTAGILHASDDGTPTSWHGFATAIHTEAIRLGLPMRTQVLHAIPSSAYPTPAVRPAHSVFDLDHYRAVVGPLDPWPTPLARHLATLTH